MANDLEEWIQYIIQGGITVIVAFLAGGFIGKLWAPLAKTLFAFGGVTMTWGLLIGAGVGAFVAAWMKKQM